MGPPVYATQTDLEHEVGDDTAEGRVGQAETVLDRRELAEIPAHCQCGGGQKRGDRDTLCGLGDDVVEELDRDAAGVLAVNRDVELHKRQRTVSRQWRYTERDDREMRPQR